MNMMKYPELFDSDGYPTDEALRLLENWAVTTDDIDGTINAGLDFTRYLWNEERGSISEELRPAERELLHAEPYDRFLRLATGRWSGNESVISALESNCWLSGLTWQFSARGGLHVYRYPRVSL